MSFGSFIAILLLLALLVISMWVMATFLGALFGPSANRFNPFVSKPSTQTLDRQPVSRPARLAACGRCGYPTRGISSFQCPECGTDLRVVGIVTGRHKAKAGSGCLVPGVFSVVVLIMAGVFNEPISDLLPTTYIEIWSIDLEPNSQQYQEVTFDTEVSGTVQKGRPNGSGGFLSHSVFNGSGYTTTFSYGQPTSPQKINKLSLTGHPNTMQASAAKTPVFNVDPRTRYATWNDQFGKIYQSSGVFTNQDVLDFLGRVGADTNRADVIQEANELFALLDGFANGMNQFTITAFDNHGSGGSSGWGTGPQWFGPVYALTWLVIWILGLVLIARRAKISRMLELSEQNPQK